MKLDFVKMSGAGNDFILLDNMDGFLDSIINPDFIRELCARRISIGADGILVLRSDPEYSFHMKYYNSDGYSAGMCGNGGRCIARFAALSGIVPETGLFSFRSDAGIHSAELTGVDSVKLWMTDPVVHYFDREIEIDSTILRVSFMNTGVPHAVIMPAGSEEISFTSIAPKIRSNTIFGEDGANVDLIWINDRSELSIRTWERGIEGETLACGTGAVAAAMCAESILHMSFPVSITPASGKILKVGKNSAGWWLQGEARIVYSGVY